jgi:surface-anchored protein
MPHPTRRATIVATAVTLALVAGTAVAAVTRDRATTTTLSPAPAAPVGTYAEPEPTATQTPTPTPTPTPTAQPTVAPATHAADPTTQPPAPPRPTATSDPVDANFGPMQPGSVTVPYHAGQTSWDVTSNGVRIRIALSHLPRAGTPVTWHVDTSTGGAGCCAIFMLYGDSYAEPPNGLPCDTTDPSVAWDHTYNRAGLHRFMVQVGKHGCQSTDGVVAGTFDVAAGTTTAQGPALPEVTTWDRSSPVPGHKGDDSWISLYADVRDVDGYVRKLVVTFGDGTSATFAGDQNTCREGGDGWPFGSEAMLPYQPPPYHHFTKPGTYTLTMTAYSTACDGSMMQAGRASFEWQVWPPQTPEPTP